MTDHQHLQRCETCWYRTEDNICLVKQKQVKDSQLSAEETELIGYVGCMSHSSVKRTPEPGKEPKTFVGKLKSFASTKHGIILFGIVIVLIIVAGIYVLKNKVFGNKKRR